jgi:hypothetical protein
VVTEPEKAGGGAALGSRPSGAVSIGFDANVVVVGAAAVVVDVVEVVTVVDVVDVVTGAGVEPEDPHAAQNITAPRSATHRRGPRRTAS